MTSRGVRFDCSRAEGGAYSRGRMTTHSRWAAADVALEDTGHAPGTLAGFPDLETGLVVLTHPLAGYYTRRDGRYWESFRLPSKRGFTARCPCRAWSFWCSCLRTGFIEASPSAAEAHLRIGDSRAQPRFASPRAPPNGSRGTVRSPALSCARNSSESRESSAHFVLHRETRTVAITLGGLFGFVTWFLVRYLVAGLYTVNQSERAVKTSFGRAERVSGATTLDDPVSEGLSAEERLRYAYPQVRVIPPGGPYYKWPWEQVFKVTVATQTIDMAKDLESPTANNNGTMLEAVTKDQLNTGLKGQIRFRVAEKNLYAYVFGVQNPIVHVMGYFIAILRERIANFEAPAPPARGEPALAVTPEAATAAMGVSINDLRKNLRELNDHMDHECRTSAARYGIVLDASLITGIDPPSEVESALAAINTAYNQVSSDISLAQAGADQKIVQSKRAVEIETLRAEAEVQPLVAVAEQLSALQQTGAGALATYVRNVRLGLFGSARRVVLEASHE